MAREGDKWRVKRGDCLWNIAKSVYKNPYKWTAIADANGISRKTHIIYTGQLLILPGITSGTSGGGSYTPPPTPVSKKVTVDWWSLDAGTERDMFCAWSYNREHTAGFNVEWWYDTGAGGWRLGAQTTTTAEIKQYGFSADEQAKKVQLKIKPYSSTYKDSKGNDQYYWTDGEWNIVEYDFSNNPPKMPSVPSIEIVDGVIKSTLENIPEDINADSIEFAVYKNNTLKYATGIAKINPETRYVSFNQTVEPGGSYTIRCRAVRNNNIYSNWTDYTSAVVSIPNSPEKIVELRPQIISEQGVKQYGVYIEWSPVDTAKNYRIEYTTNISYFDTPGGDVTVIDTQEDEGFKYLISDMELGHEYFFRVCARNDEGLSGYTPIKSTKLGERPQPPTTWSNTANSIVGEDLNLYWVHNSTDGSLERYARLNIIAKDMTNPSLEPIVITKVIQNTRSEEDKNTISVYTINTSDPDWSFLKQGYAISWKVQTAGIIDEYSDWSVEREVNIYSKPEVILDIKNQNGASVSEINTFPFYINVLAKPAAQTPISYYLEVIANSGYETVDSTGKKITVNPGDKVYQKYYDPTTNPWNFVAEMTPGNIDLHNGIVYTVNCTVAMNSSLTATGSIDFTVLWEEKFYNVYADVIVNKETLEASIHPYCKEYYVDEETGETLERLTEDCTLNVYRREYDGSFTLILDKIANSDNIYITDPHPSLDFARYRITATSNETGSISYDDIKGIEINEPSVVIQWAEEWVPFETDNDSDSESNLEPKWSGSMIKIPYNVDVNETSKKDVSLIEYIGRENPVSYYGTHNGESATWNVVIPKEDKNLIYALRRLSKYAGDVYVREPSGIGYWANIGVQFGIKHLDVTVPVTFTVKRVEGGI